MTQLTKQEAFNQVWNGLKAQGFTRSVRPDNPEICAYRGLDGKKCGIGILIKDEEYQTRMEGVSVSSLTLLGILPARLVHLHDQRFLIDIQNCHDSNRTPLAMETALKKLAWANYLTIPE